MRTEVIVRFWYDGEQRIARIEAEGVQASALLHLISAALNGSREEWSAARIAWDMTRGLTRRERTARLGISLRTEWDIRVRNGLPVDGRPSSLEV